MKEEAYFNFQWPSSAKSVYVTGSFDDWSKSVKLSSNKNGNGFSCILKLPKERTIFKFVVDDVWLTSPDLKLENDDSGNQNNILYPEDLMLFSEIHKIASNKYPTTEIELTETEAEAETATETETSTSDKLNKPQHSKSDAESYSFCSVSHSDFSPSFGKLDTYGKIVEDQSHINIFYLDDVCDDDEPVILGNDSEGDDEISDGELINSSTQCTLSGIEETNHQNPDSSTSSSMNYYNNDNKKFQYDSSVSLFKKFTRFFK